MRNASQKAFDLGDINEEKSETKTSKESGVSPVKTSVIHTNPDIIEEDDDYESSDEENELKN